MSDPDEADLEFFFEFASNYSYLSVMRLAPLAEAAGLRVRWRPFLLGPIFQAQGWTTSPFVLYPQKGRYALRDTARLCAKYGLPWTPPTAFPRHSLLAARVATVGLDQPWLVPYSQRVMHANFAEDRDIGEPAVIGGILSELGLPADTVLAQAAAPPVKEALRTATAEAQRRGAFGAPTVFVGEEMFWGNDRLEDALQWARDRRIAGAPSDRSGPPLSRR